ncbi:hypothetical protein [Saccharothrix obliqua]|uniref:hypothetical protein n=1 Tax=Saccharothrix obliqua TaxID=2861747 RepID=UPI001C5F7B33|nr:hypothetical protein [Saccharothrix obliqua]MBW4722004.1 hypothetical protein [Saccharothrix obliqua]
MAGKLRVGPVTHTVLEILFAVVVVVGGCGLLLTVGVTDVRGREVDCGSVVTGVRSAVPAAEEATCASVLGSRGAWAWPTTIVGLAGVLLVVFLAPFVDPKPRWWGRPPPALPHR